MAEREQHPSEDLYGVLGVAPEATNQEILAAYQRLVGEIVAGQAPVVQRQAIEEAFETLGDPIRRLRYDAQATAPPPPRFQMPAIRLPGGRLSIRLPRRSPIKRPDLPHVDPILAAAIALVAIVGLTVLLLPLLRGRSKPSPPPQSVADLVPSPTSTQTPTSPSQTPVRPGGVQGLVPGGLGAPGASPLPPSGALGGLLGPPGGGGQPASEPPFITGSAIVDMLRAVVAATAVRNAPAQAAAGAPPGALGPGTPSNSLLQPNPAPAGIQITGVGQVPPVVGAAQPAAGAVGSSAPPAPTATPAPNHIAVPAGPVSALGAPLGAAQAAGAATVGPNRFAPAPTPSR